MLQRFSKSTVGVSVLLYLIASAASARPVCETPSSDPDGDGFGWENGETCLVVEQSPASLRVTGATQSTGTGAGLAICQSASSDSDGDGFGWEANRSCRVASSSATSTTTESGNSHRTCSSSASDPDGDGFGWENNRSCVVSGTTGSNPGSSSTQGSSARPGSSSVLLPEEKVTLPIPACSDQRFDPDNDGFGWENSRSCTFKNAGDGGRSITDVVLVTGQSNALGAETTLFDSYNIELDSPVARVYAYSQNGWGIAGLRQIWDRVWYPRANIASDPANNFAFHFGKSLVRKNPDAVVGIIMVTAPGAGIEHWNRDGDFFAQINSRVRAALDQLPGDAKVRGILWHQGETDFYSTSFYRDRLRGLIRNFRAQSWHANDALFICGETLNAPVNAQLNALNTDTDSATGCVKGSDLQSIGDDIHFDAKSLRTLGARYADKYQSLRVN